MPPPFDLQSCFRAEGGSTSERMAGREESGAVKGLREKLQTKSSFSHVQKALEERKKNKTTLQRTQNLADLYLENVYKSRGSGDALQASRKDGGGGVWRLSSEFIKFEVL